MSRETLYVDVARRRADVQFLVARNVHSGAHAGRGAPRTYPRHQPNASIVSGCARAKQVVPAATRRPRVAGWPRTRFSVTR